MKKVTLIHTVKPLVYKFEKELKQQIPNIEVDNILDEYILKYMSKQDYKKSEFYDRLSILLNLASSTNSDLILSTCSSLSEGIDSLKANIHVPVFKIDEEMLNRAIESKKKITVIATAKSTIEPMINRLRKIADKKHVELNVQAYVLEKAYYAMQKGDINLHDEIIKNECIKLSNLELVVLAQASMAHLAKEISTITKCEVLSSIDLAIKLIDRELNKENN